MGNNVALRAWKRLRAVRERLPPRCETGGQGLFNPFKPLRGNKFANCATR